MNNGIDTRTIVFLASLHRLLLNLESQLLLLLIYYNNGDDRMKQKEQKRTEYLTARETAKLMKISLVYLYKLTHTKKIKFYKPFPKKILFDREYIDNFILASEIPLASEIEQKAEYYGIEYDENGLIIKRS